MENAADILLERVRVEEAVIRLFIDTDRRDWVGVRACFNHAVLFDMSSVGGGAASTVGPDEIVAGWEAGLAPLEHVHHQVGNFITEVRDTQATVFCYGIAIHHKKTQSGRDTRTFVGSYDIRLRRTPRATWVIHGFRFELKFLDGNLELEKG